jgi:MYXO-CTERM domain-containing protein
VRERSRAAERQRSVALLVGCVTWCAVSSASAATLDWAGHTWQLTSGGMAGVCDGNPANVSVDGNGYLHMRISHDGGTWSASELFTTDRLGFGTYQWQVEGPIDSYDKNVVLGLFPYGPQANIGSDGTNEIDIEYSRWGQANGDNGDFTDYPAQGKTVGEESFTFSLSGLTSTSRFEWSSTRITDFLFEGLEPLTGGAEPLKTWSYAPSEPTTNIPQAALPLGMNLWCFDAPPSDGAPVEIVIHSFEFVAEGAAGAGGAPGGAGGMGNAGGTGAAVGASNAGGKSGGGNAGGKSSAGNAGTASGAAGTPGSGGAASAAAGGRNAGGGGMAGRVGAAGSGGPSAGATQGGGGLGGVTELAGAPSNGGVSPSGGASPAAAAPRDGARSAGCACSLASAANSSTPAAAAASLLLLAWFGRRRRGTPSASP